MKLRLKYYKVILILILGIACIFIPYFFIKGTTILLNKDAVWLIFFLLLELAALIRLWYTILFEFYKVELTQNSITLKNIITKKQTVIEAYITGFKINPISGKFTLIDQDGDIVAILNAFHYSNVSEAIEYLGLKRN